MASLFCLKSIFGGDIPWSPLDWTNSDDTVRGGSSVSNFTISPTSPIAVFHGNLDIKTLGGAGFASQRTTGEDRNWDLSSYEGLVLDIAKSDEKHYTLTLKDELLPLSADGREQSTVSWEYDFKVKSEGEKVYIQWESFKPTYRGREQNDTKPLDLKHVKRISFMMRSFFGTQEGDFSLSITSMSAFSKKNNSTDEHETKKRTGIQSRRDCAKAKDEQSWFSWAFGSCTVS